MFEKFITAFNSDAKPTKGEHLLIFSLLALLSYDMLVRQPLSQLKDHFK